MTVILMLLCVSPALIVFWIGRRQVRELRGDLARAVASRDRWEALAMEQVGQLTAARKILDALSDPGTMRADQVRVALERDGRGKALARKGFAGALKDPRNDNVRNRFGGWEDGKNDDTGKAD